MTVELLPSPSKGKRKTQDEAGTPPPTKKTTDVVDNMDVDKDQTGESSQDESMEDREAFQKNQDEAMADETAETHAISQDIGISQEEEHQTDDNLKTSGTANETNNTEAAEPIPITTTANAATYEEAARKAKDIVAPTEAETVYTARRLLITVEIGMPKDAVHRGELLSNQLNLFLELARKCSRKQLRVIKYAENRPNSMRNKKEWLKKFKGTGSDHLIAYTHGFFSWQPLRDGAFRLKVYLAVPLKSGQSIETFIRVLGEAWGDNQRATVMDLLGQDLYSPKKIGWLFRSHRIMANTRDLQQELTRHADRLFVGLKFGLTNQSIPDPSGAKWDPATSVKAVMIEINEDRYSESWKFLTDTYNGKNSTPPFGIHMRFVGLKDHQDFKGNPNALHNMSILMKRQTVFTDDSITTATSKLLSIDDPISGTKTLRMILMELTPTCSGEGLRKARLFHSISRNLNRAGIQEYHFTYNRAVKNEASSIVSSICEFIRDEIKIDPEDCCYAHFVRDDYKWDPLTRTGSNPDTDALDFMVEESADLIVAGTEAAVEIVIDENEEMDESSKVARERDRCLGLNDEETIKSMTKKKVKRKVVPANVRQGDASVVSGISKLTDFSSSTQASKERKSLRKAMTAQQATIAAQSEQIALLLAAMGENKPATTTAQISEPTQVGAGVENTKPLDREASPNRDDDPRSEGVRFKMSENKEHPADGGTYKDPSSKTARKARALELAKLGRLEFIPAEVAAEGVANKPIEVSSGGSSSESCTSEEEDDDDDDEDDDEDNGDDEDNDNSDEDEDKERDDDDDSKDDDTNDDDARNDRKIKDGNMYNEENDTDNNDNDEEDDDDDDDDDSSEDDDDEDDEDKDEDDGRRESRYSRKHDSHLDSSDEDIAPNLKLAKGIDGDILDTAKKLKNTLLKTIRKASGGDEPGVDV